MLCVKSQKTLTIVPHRENKDVRMTNTFQSRCPETPFWDTKKSEAISSTCESVWRFLFEIENTLRYISQLPTEIINRKRKRFVFCWSFTICHWCKKPNVIPFIYIFNTVWTNFNFLAIIKSVGEWLRNHRTCSLTLRWNCYHTALSFWK